MKRIKTLATRDLKESMKRAAAVSARNPASQPARLPVLLGTRAAKR